MVAGLHGCAVGASIHDGSENNGASEATPADQQTWNLNVPPDDEQIYGHKSRELLPMEQVKEATEKEISLMTEHGTFEIVPETEVRGKKTRAAVARRLREGWREK